MEPFVSDDQVQSQIIEDCAAQLPPLALKGIQLFNAGHYFEAHEELENAWRQETRPVRELYRGVLQVAVAYYHISRGNLVGAQKMFKRSKRWLAPFPDVCQGIHVGQVQRDAAAVELALQSHTPQEVLDLHLLKPVQMD